MTEPLTISAAQVTPSTSTEGERACAVLVAEKSVQSLVETRDALLRLLEALPRDLASIQALLRERVSPARIDVIPLDASGEVAFLTRPAKDLVVLIVAPRPDRVCLAVDPLLPPELLCLALLHGLGHMLLGHI